MDMKKFLKIIGDKIRAIRKSKRMSQEKLAELSRLHPTYISNIENGKVNASIFTYYMIANALGIPLSELIGLTGDRVDTEIEMVIADLLSSIRRLSKKKQAVFLSASKGLLAAIEKIK